MINSFAINLFLITFWEIKNYQSLLSSHNKIFFSQKCVKIDLVVQKLGRNMTRSVDHNSLLH
jgi:hypothetical protein